MGTNWRMDASCTDVDPEVFFTKPGGKASVRKAKMICQECPVRAECLAFATDNAIEFGIYGGLTPAERDNERYAGANGVGMNNRVLAGCGTTAGYTYHLRHNTQPCKACEAAEAHRNMVYKKRRLARRQDREMASA